MRSLEEALSLIESAFASAPRPPDEALIHEECRSDDTDIEPLYGVPHWHDLLDDAVEGTYAALFFLSPAGFRHFLPAYMSWVLRNPDSGAAVVDATIFALTPAASDELRAFTLSKFTLLDAAQRSAIVAFLEVMASHTDASAALDYWRPGGAMGRGA
jgi:hypothetical protein